MAALQERSRPFLYAYTVTNLNTCSASIVLNIVDVAEEGEFILISIDHPAPISINFTSRSFRPLSDSVMNSKPHRHRDSCIT